MQNLKEAAGLIKIRKFLETYTTLNPTGGVRHRLAGVGTNKKDNVKELTDEEKNEIRTGLKKFVIDVNKVIENI